MVSILSYKKRLEALKSERSSFISLYKDLSDYHLAHRGRFLTSDRNKGHKRNIKQLNNTSRMSSRILSSGMMSGITSPARPWFRLSSGDNALDEYASVKKWLFIGQSIMYRVFSSSNLYNSLHTIYSELGVFGTGALGVYEDFENVIWCKPYTVGSYMLGMDGKNVIDTFYREYELTVGQCIKQFGLENCSNSVQDQWKKGNTESWVKINHAMEPNDDRDQQSPLARDKKFRSVYFEDSGPKKGDQDLFLKKSGFDTFPVMTPRWDVTAEDVYATDCPGMTALGDTKALQHGEKKLYQAVDKVGQPPLQGDISLKGKMNAGVLKGDDVLWVPKHSEGLTSIYGNYRPDIAAIKGVNQDTENRIKKAFYEDLFLMLANSDRRQTTAREVAEKHEEKLFMLGPALERFHNELLDLLIDRTFNILQKNGVLPPAPPELEGKELDVEYVSVLAQAQRLVNTGSIDRIAAFTSGLAQVWPGARHKINAEQAVDEYAAALGVDPSVINSDEKVAELNAVDAQMAQQAQQMAQLEQSVKMAKDAGGIETGDGNLAGAVMQNTGMV